MTVKNALKLHNGDEVIVKRFKEAMTVIETEVIPASEETNNHVFVNVMLDDGNWYNHKEII